MMFAPSPGSPLQALAMKWQMLAVMLVALAREVSLAHKMRAGAGVPKAELLEAALYAALVQLSGDIAAASASPDRSAADEDARLYLKTAHALLGVTALLIRQLKADLEAARAVRAALAGKPAFYSQAVIRPRPSAPPFLDSG